MRYSEHEWFSAYMQPDETVLWRGKPDRHESFDLGEAAKGTPMLLMIFWGVFLLYLVLCKSGSMPDAVKLAAIGIILLWLTFAAYIGFIGPIRHLLQRRNAEYVITSRRILRSMGNIVDGLDGAMLPAPHVRRGSMHFGDIEFGTWPLPPPGRHSRKPSLAVAASFALHATPHVDQVMAVIRSMDTSCPITPLNDKTDFPLEDGERLLWRGHPEKTGLPLTFTMHTNAEDLFGGLWCTILGGIAIGIFIMGMAAEWPEIPPVLPIVMLPFAGVFAFGLYKLGLGSLRISRRAKREEYAITDRRILRRTGSRITAHDIRRDNVLCLCQGRDGCGTIVLGNTSAPFRSKIQPRGGPDLTRYPGFQLRCIADPTAAMDALRYLLSASASTEDSE